MAKVKIPDFRAPSACWRRAKHLLPSRAATTSEADAPGPNQVGRKGNCDSLKHALAAPRIGFSKRQLILNPLQDGNLPTGMRCEEGINKDDIPSEENKQENHPLCRAIL